MATPQKPPEEFELTLRALPSDVPTIIRLRRALKALLRFYEFRVTGIRQTSPPPDDNAASPGPGSAHSG